MFDNDNEITRGNLPAMQLHDESISAVWSGGGRQVYITEAQHGSTRSILSQIKFKLEGLLPYTSYETRVRSIGKNGPSHWSSPNSAAVRTKPALTQVLTKVPTSTKSVLLLRGNLKEPPNIMDHDFASGAAAEVASDRMVEMVLLSSHLTYITRKRPHRHHSSTFVGATLYRLPTNVYSSTVDGPGKHNCVCGN